MKTPEEILKHHLAVHMSGGPVTAEQEAEFWELVKTDDDVKSLFAAGMAAMQEYAKQVAQKYREALDKGREMRQHQRTYFKTRTKTNMEISIKFEGQFDKLLADLAKPPQTQNALL